MADLTPVRLERTTDSGTWDALVESLTPEPAFHRADWLDLQSKLNGFLVERLLVLEEDRPIGVVPVPRRSRRSIEGIDAPFPYLGPLVPAERLSATIAALRTWQRRNGLVISHFEFGPAAAPSTLETLTGAGAQAHADSTVLVDLAHGSADALRAGYSSLRRRDIRRAIRDGATVRNAHPGELTALLPRVLEEAFHAHGKPSPYPEDVGEQVEAWAEGRSDVGTFTALVNGEPAGVQVVLGGGEIALAWVGACLRAYRSANPNVLLYDRLLEWALETGHRTVDLVGRVDEGVLRYKMAFGGVETPYTVARSTLIPQPLLTAAGKARRLIKR
ncbi:GNAT family N-acetyltransferase [Amnibacterium sp.]|uniref:GNAT family N-acetyltransferase n=1 Tax=Amnibacterium sp. TaxID=1872496 RepID=UPI003F7C7D8D